MTQSDKDLAKIAEDASPRRHAEISPVKVKDLNLMNNKLPPAEILCEVPQYMQLPPTQRKAPQLAHQGRSWNDRWEKS